MPSDEDKLTSGEVARFVQMVRELPARAQALGRELVNIRGGGAYDPEELAIMQEDPDPRRAAIARALAELRAARDATTFEEQLRVKHSTYQLTNDQRDRIKELALVLKLGAFEELESIGESEIVRAALETFLGLPGNMQLALLRDNRQNEKKSKYGLYTPRERGGE